MASRRELRHTRHRAGGGAHITPFGRLFSQGSLVLPAANLPRNTTILWTSDHNGGGITKRDRLMD